MTWELFYDRKQLESKARLYEELKGRALEEEEGGGAFLVDFEQKAVDEVMEKRHARLKKVIQRA